MFFFINREHQYRDSNWINRRKNGMKWKHVALSVSIQRRVNSSNSIASFPKNSVYSFRFSVLQGGKMCDRLMRRQFAQWKFQTMGARKNYENIYFSAWAHCSNYEFMAFYYRHFSADCTEVCQEKLYGAKNEHSAGIKVFLEREKKT